jgi:hypothetical protein
MSKWPFEWRDPSARLAPCRVQNGLGARLARLGGGPMGNRSVEAVQLLIPRSGRTSHGLDQPFDLANGKATLAAKADRSPVWGLPRARPTEGQPQGKRHRQT